MKLRAHDAMHTASNNAARGTADRFFFWKQTAKKCDKSSDWLIMDGIGNFY